MANLKALIVDDDPKICDTVSAQVGVLRDDFRVANSTDEAHQLLETEKFDYVILDLQLPPRIGNTPEVCFGKSFLGIIRDSYDKETMPVIVMTGHDSHNLAADMLLRDANTFITKPLDDDALLDSIRKFTKHKRTDLIQQNQDDSVSWLTRESRGHRIIWRTRAKNGNVREYSLDLGATRTTVLDCIFLNYKKNPLINYWDFIQKVGWGEEAFFAKTKGRKPNAANGPLKSHIANIRKNLAIDVVFEATGIMVCQPED